MTVAHQEFIGLRATVLASKHPPYVGLAGAVVDETMKTLTLDVGGAERVVPKVGQRFQFTLLDGSRETLEGRDVALRPEDRTRKARPRQAMRRATHR